MSGERRAVRIRYVVAVLTASVFGFYVGYGVTWFLLDAYSRGLLLTPGSAGPFVIFVLVPLLGALLATVLDRQSRR